MPVIEVDNLVKWYKDVQALAGVSLAVEQGEIYGLLGRNGAGKTTMVKILLSIVHPTSGQVKLLGRPVGDADSRMKIGYLPEDHRFPEYHSAVTALQFYGGLSGMTRADRKRRIPELIDLVGLKHAAKRKVRTYSKGMKQRLGLAQAILHDPEVVFLDEPTDGVDPLGRKEIRDVLLRLKAQGKTIFLNSHLLSEVELITDRVTILDLGKTRREGTVDQLTTTRDVYEIRFEGTLDPILPEIQSRVRSLARFPDRIEVEVEGKPQLNVLIDLLRQKGVLLTGLADKRQSLEQIFIETISGGLPQATRVEAEGRR